MIRLATLLALLLSPAAARADGLAGYWHGFWQYWGNTFGTQDGVSMLVLGVLIVSIFIITRGKWKK